MKMCGNRWVAVAALAVVGTVAAVGCRTEALPPPPPAAPMIAPASAYEQARDDLMRGPGIAAVGRVAAVRPGNMTAAVEDLPAGQFHRGQILTLVGTDEKPVAHAEVDNVEGSWVVVKYQPITRPPQENDLAVATK